MRLGVIDEGLCAIATLQQEGLAAGHRRELTGELLDLGGDGDRGHAFQHGAHRLGLLGVPTGLLRGRFVQRGIQPFTQVGRQRRQRRQLLDRYVNGPVHPVILTGP